MDTRVVLLHFPLASITYYAIALVCFAERTTIKFMTLTPVNGLAMSGTEIMKPINFRVMLKIDVFALHSTIFNLLKS
jgi:hypothetical protein